MRRNYLCSEVLYAFAQHCLASREVLVIDKLNACMNKTTVLGIIIIPSKIASSFCDFPIARSSVKFQLQPHQPWLRGPNLRRGRRLQQWRRPLLPAALLRLRAGPRAPRPPRPGGAHRLHDPGRRGRHLHAGHVLPRLRRLREPEGAGRVRGALPAENELVQRTEWRRRRRRRAVQ